MIVNFPFAAYIFHNDSNFWKWRHFDLVRNLMGKAIINGNWKLSNGNFWLKLNMLLLCLQKTSKFETFFAIQLLYFYCEGFRKTLKLCKMWKYWKWNEIGPSCKATFVSKDNRVQNIFWEDKKSTKVGQKQKNLLSSLA